MTWKHFVVRAVLSAPICLGSGQFARWLGLTSWWWTAILAPLIAIILHLAMMHVYERLIIADMEQVFQRRAIRSAVEAGKLTLAMLDEFDTNLGRLVRMPLQPSPKKEFKQ